MNPCRALLYFIPKWSIVIQIPENIKQTPFKSQSSFLWRVRWNSHRHGILMWDNAYTHSPALLPKKKANAFVDNKEKKQFQNNVWLCCQKASQPISGARIGLGPLTIVMQKTSSTSGSHVHPSRLGCCSFVMQVWSEAYCWFCLIWYYISYENWLPETIPICKLRSQC